MKYFLKNKRNSNPVFKAKFNKGIWLEKKIKHRKKSSINKTQNKEKFYHFYSHEFLVQNFFYKRI